jgi:membrane-bound ClpP family serine protease
LSGELKDAVTYAKEAAQTRRRKCSLEAGLRNILQIKDIETIKKRVVELLNNDLPEEPITEDYGDRGSVTEISKRKTEITTLPPAA